MAFFLANSPAWETRLVFANGIVSLSVATGVFIIIFSGTSHRLIPLFAVGVFLAFSHSRRLAWSGTGGVTEKE